MIRLRCQCGKKLKLPANLVGKLAACPDCRRKVRIVATEFHAETDADRLDGMLVIAEGPERTGEQLYLGGQRPIDVGKGEESVLRLRAQSVSRVHCTLVPGDYGWRIEDRGSTNGVYVNGRRIRGHNLLDGDVVHVGDFALRYLTDPDKKRANLAPARRIVPSPSATAVAHEAPDGNLHLLDDLATLEQTAAMSALSARPAAASAPVAEDSEEVFRIADDQSERRARATETGQDGNVCPNCSHPLAPEARICVFCGTDLETGRRMTTVGDFAPRATESPAKLGAYVRDCFGSFAFFINPGSLVTFLIVAFIAALNLIVTFAPFGGLASFVLQGWLCSFYFNVVVTAANGEKDLPDLALTGGWWDDVIAPFFKFMGAWVVVLSPAIVGTMWVISSAVGQVALGAPGGNPLSTVPWLLALFGAGIFLWPITILIIALAGFGPFMRPDLILSTLTRTFVPYLVTCLMTAVAFSATYAAKFALLSVGTLFGGNPFVAGIVLWVLNAYCWIVAMRCVGLYYHHFKGRFAWSWG